jgi:hypothetical protein
MPKSLQSLHDIDWASIRRAARDSSPVGGYTHSFYRYPARFSPFLARTLISHFTRPGDFILDPFAGGGTTLVEALALGRMAAGSDISGLATFIARVKTRIITDLQIDVLRRWGSTLPALLNFRSIMNQAQSSPSRVLNINSPHTWRLRDTVRAAVESTDQLLDRRSRDFAKCVVLSAAQWALDGRRTTPSVGEFRSRLSLTLEEMLRGATEFREAVLANTPASIAGPRRGRIPIIQGKAAQLSSATQIIALGTPRLILTSPPYVGVHVIYHRWQVGGRRETSLPFDIVGREDGNTSSYYTFGHRQSHHKAEYYANLSASFTALSRLIDHDTVIAQVVGFSNPRSQLPRYLRVLEEVGLEEIRPPLPRARRLWRFVPNRRWYNRTTPVADSRAEVVLFHRLSP